MSVNAKVYMKQEAEEMVVASGGVIIVESGGVINANAGTVRSPEIVRNIHTRVTVAQVNAGHTLLPAVSGYKYRMLDCLAIAVGGAAGAVTTVDILGTQSTAKKLVAFAQASLTQSAVLRAGGTGADVLADGASFAANDANTAITIGKTGSSVTTATHIDVVLSYTLEAE